MTAEFSRVHANHMNTQLTINPHQESHFSHLPAKNFSTFAIRFSPHSAKLVAFTYEDEQQRDQHQTGFYFRKECFGEFVLEILERNENRIVEKT